ncbi:MAG: hypothetical protein VR72_16070 [Clostridiaceae bacterium BRH_c20a]|nr:MAG: hypothetical protein VR72_16070 [Clostridiaceae bacterium BRH_c20a]
MFSNDVLKQMCIPPATGKSYYRPFICNGDLSKVDIFFVGINPATPISPIEIDIDSYVSLLLNYDEFIRFYKEYRISQDKDQISRTRMGMNSFLSWLANHTDLAVIETDAIPYPTANVKELKREPKHVIDKGKEIFYQLVTEFQPKLLILHGKKTVEHVAYILTHGKVIPPGQVDLEQSIEQMELKSPIIEFNYPNGKKGYIMACRHFMYYGSTGDSFEEFRKRILSIVKGFTMEGE